MSRETLLLNLLKRHLEAWDEVAQDDEYMVKDESVVIATARALEAYGIPFELHNIDIPEPIDFLSNPTGV